MGKVTVCAVWTTKERRWKDVNRGVYLKRIHNKITGQAYVLSLLFLRYRPTPTPNPSTNPISRVPLIYFVIFNL